VLLAGTAVLFAITAVLSVRTAVLSRRTAVLSRRTASGSLLFAQLSTTAHNGEREDQLTLRGVGERKHLGKKRVGSQNLHKALFKTYTLFRATLVQAFNNVYISPSAGVAPVRPVFVCSFPREGWRMGGD
jgi:hypothetical protein